MNYTKEQLMPKRYPQFEPVPRGDKIKYWTIHKDRQIIDYWWDGDHDHETGSWDAYVKWFIDIPGAPEEVKPLAHPEHKPEREGTYIAYDTCLNEWTSYYFNGFVFWMVDADIDYFINVRLEDLEKEDDTEETVVSVDMINGKPTISNISAKQFHVEQLEKMGFDVQLIKREPEIAPCPGCWRDCKIEMLGIDTYRVTCECGYCGPKGYTQRNAILRHNLICERK